MASRKVGRAMTNVPEIIIVYTLLRAVRAAIRGDRTEDQDGVEVGEDLELAPHVVPPKAR